VKNWSAAACALLAAGCLDAIGPDVGPVRSSCTGADSDPSTDIDFERDIRVGIFQTYCDVCHSPAGATPIGLQIGGLDLSTHATLIEGGVHGATSIVVPGDACASILFQKVGPAPPFGGRMPLDRAQLSPAHLQQLVDWIAEGAND
jgi:hypothetical protein